jgi:hypothetical protein
VPLQSHHTDCWGTGRAAQCATTAALPGASASLRWLGYSDQGGRPHGVQIMVYNDHAYIGQARYGGFTVLDVSNPREARPAAFVPTAPGIWNMHLQVHDTLLLVCDSANLRSAYASQAAYYGQQLGGFDSRALGQRGVDFTAGMRVRHLHTRCAEATSPPLTISGIRCWTSSPTSTARWPSHSSGPTSGSRCMPDPNWSGLTYAGLC